MQNIEENYEIISYISKGTYGKVYHVRKNGKEYALKLCSLYDDIISSGLLHETSVLQNISDESFIKIYDIFIGTMNNLTYVCILLEYSGKRLSETNNLNPNDIYKALCTSISKLNTQGFYHGDLSSSNILMQDGKPKLIDFNLSSRIYRNNTLSFLPPTVSVRPYELLKTKAIKKYDPRTIDTWSIGCIFYYLLKRENIIKINDNAEEYKTARSILKYKLDKLIKQDEFTNEQQMYLEMCLHIYPDGRLIPADLIKSDIKTEILKQKKLYDTNSTITNDIMKNIHSRLLNYGFDISDEVIYLTMVNIKRLNTIKLEINHHNYFIYALMTFFVTIKVITADDFDTTNIMELIEFVYWTEKEIVKLQIDICDNLEWNIDCTTAYNYVFYIDARYHNYYKILIIMMNNNLQFNKFTEFCKAKVAYRKLKEYFGVNIDIFETNNDDLVSDCEELLPTILIIDDGLISVMNSYNMTNTKSWIKMLEKK